MKNPEQFIINFTLVMSLLLTVGIVGHYATTPSNSPTNMLRMLPKPNKPHSLCVYSHVDANTRVTYITCVCDNGNVRIVPSQDCTCYAPTPHNVGVRCFCDDIYEERMIREIQQNDNPIK